MAEAARSLGLSRQYLYELLPRYAPECRASTDTPDAVGAVGRTDTIVCDATAGGVSTTRAGSLTYGRRRPTLPSMESVGKVDTVRTAIDLPRSWLDWLEREALRRKQSGQLSRLAKSPVVLEALDLLRRRLEENS